MKTKTLLTLLFALSTTFSYAELKIDDAIKNKHPELINLLSNSKMLKEQDKQDFINLLTESSEKDTKILLELLKEENQRWEKYQNNLNNKNIKNVNDIKIEFPMDFAELATAKADEYSKNYKIANPIEEKEI